MNQKNDAYLIEPGNCISYRLRRTSRAVARHFDKALKPAGVRNTQFTLLSTLAAQGETAIGELATSLGVDATTLTRNLNVLERRGLVGNVSSDDARERRVRLREAGHKTFTTALPLWQAAQQNLLSSLNDGGWPEMMLALSNIEQTCNSSG